MDFRTVNDRDWESLRYSLEEVESIKKRSLQIVSWLGDVFDHGDAGSMSGLKFEPVAEDSIICRISSPCCIGRLRQSWRIIDEKLVGVIEVDRKIYDMAGEKIWQLVWAVIVPERGQIYINKASDGFYMNNMSGNLNNDLFRLGMSIYYSLVSGPVV